jgi:transposase-like protein
MKTTTTSPLALASAPNLHSLVEDAYGALTESFEQFCLMAGIESLTQLMNEDVAQLAGERYEHCPGKPGYRWGHSKAQIGFHGGKIGVDRPRVRSKTTGKEIVLPSWEEISAAGYLDQWAMNLMVMNVATRKFRRAVRLPEAGVPAQAGSGLSKSAVSRRFKALTQAKFDAWMGSDLSGLDLVAIQIDGLHLNDRLLMIGAVGIEVSGQKHPLGVIEGATENAATVQALLDNLIERGLDPAACYLFIVDGAKALSKALRRTFGADIPIQRCQVHKARNIIDRLAPKHHAAVRRALKQAWELDDADKAERLMRNLARRFEQEAPDVSKSILEGLDEILTVVRLGLPIELRRSLASTNIIESMNSVIRQVCRNVKRWRDARMALRWTAAGMFEARKGFRRLKAYKQLHILKKALIEHRKKRKIDPIKDAA